MLSLFEQLGGAIKTLEEQKRSNQDYKTRLKKDGVSEKILAYLRKRPLERTTTKISNDLGIEPHIVRHACRRLEERGEVEFVRFMTRKNTKVCIFKAKEITGEKK